MPSDIIRRLLWLLSTLFFATAPIFWALTRAMPERVGDPTARLPMFFNLEPEGVQEHVERAVRELTASKAPVEIAARSLVALGGASFPHLLPRMDSLRPEDRGRVALALAPVAARMGGVRDESAFSDAESAILYWNRFWEEHQIDFRPAVVRRVVRRFAERPSAIREMELRRLDTFALPEVVEAMRPATSAEDLERIRHLTRVASLLAGRGDALPAEATLADARRAMANWEAYLRDHGARFRTLTGATRVGAIVLETRYGKWAQDILRTGLGRDQDGVAISEGFRERAPATLGLVLSGWLLGYPLGMAVAAVALVAGRPGARRAATLSALALVGATSVGLVAALATLVQGLLGAVLTVVTSTAAAVALRSESTWVRLVERPFVRTTRALGGSLRAQLLGVVRLATGPWLAAAATDLPLLVSAAFVAEHAFGIEGLGEVTVSALRDGNVTWLLGLALLGAFLVGVGQIGMDWSHRSLDPRHAAKTRHRDGAPS